MAQDTVGRQWIRSTDSIGANLVEGDGRGSDQDALRFFIIARASLRESRYWLLLASDRSLVTADFFCTVDTELGETARQLNALINYRKRAIGNSRVHEARLAFSSTSDFEPNPRDIEPSSLESRDTLWSTADRNEPLSFEPRA